MAYKTVFMRYELKYLIDHEQKEKIMKVMEPYMKPDKYGRTIIRNIYYDTDSYRLVRHSIESPPYKEKLRVRSYAKAEPGSTVFVELKKKYKSVVYKRRLPMPETQAMKWFAGDVKLKEKTQIAKEIEYFMNYYRTIHPVLFLSYEREAFYGREDENFRVTFDENILCRQEVLSLQADVWGIPILPAGKVLMELKCAGGIPLWMVRFLSKERIFKTSFSKYGTAYKNIIYPQLQQSKEARIYA